MKTKKFFGSAAIVAAAMVLLLGCVILLFGYRFSSAHSARYGSVYYYGTNDSGTVYTDDGKITYYPKKNKLVYENGDVYEGEIRGYLPNGIGVYTSAYGEVIDGEFSDGLANGYCRVTLASGNRYEGLITDGEWDENGTLTLVYSDGEEIPQGSFVNSRLEGEIVTYSYRNGANYVGGYQNGLPHGVGTLTYANGDKYEGDFLAGEIVGNGKYTFADGSVYEGAFENSLPNGEGSYTYTALNGKKVTLSGKFINGVRIEQFES